MATQATAGGNNRRRLAVLAGGLLAGCMVLAWQVRQSAGAVFELPLFDFVEYWAAGRLNAHGANPYDPAAVAGLERQAGRTEDPVLMWNPPWTLSLVMPLGLLPVRTAHALWLALQFGVLLLCADRLWLFYGGAPARRWCGWLIGLTFLPSCLALTAGQISPLLLLGAVGFLVHQRRGHDTAAGAAAALLAIKPHLAYLFWPALLLWCWRERRWRVLAGGVAAGAAATAIPLLYNPAVLGQYWQTLAHRPPAQYLSPTLGSVLRLAFGEDRFGLQFVPTLLGAAWFVPYWLRHRDGWDWGERLPAVLLASMLTAAYGAWPFDLVLLLPAVMLCATAVAGPGRHTDLWLGAAVLVAVNGVALVQVVRAEEYFWFLWMAPALAAAYVVLRRRTGATAAVAA